MYVFNFPASNVISLIAYQSNTKPVILANLTAFSTPFRI